VSISILIALAACGSSPPEERPDGGSIIARDSGALARDAGSDAGAAPRGDAGTPAGECASPVEGALVYFDDFEDAAAGERFVGRGAGGFAWIDLAWVSASDRIARSGDVSAEFAFEGSEADGAWSQLAFDLGALYREVTLAFALYVPNGEEPYGGAAYRHRGGANNKFFRLFPGPDYEGGYGSGEKVGASFWGQDDGFSHLMDDWAEDGTAAVGPGFAADTVPSFLGAAELGRWTRMRIEVIAATAKGSGPGAIRIYKDGVLVSEEHPDNFTEGQPHAYRFGYLLGTANSGFDEDTFLFADDVCIVALP
jgi:hypothetical protein